MDEDRKMERGVKRIEKVLKKNRRLKHADLVAPKIWNMLVEKGYIKKKFEVLIGEDINSHFAD